jgi:hypothetical protein
LAAIDKHFPTGPDALYAEAVANGEVQKPKITYHDVYGERVPIVHVDDGDETRFFTRTSNARQRPQTFFNGDLSGVKGASQIRENRPAKPKPEPRLTAAQVMRGVKLDTTVW